MSGAPPTHLRLGLLETASLRRAPRTAAVALALFALAGCAGDRARSDVAARAAKADAILDGRRHPPLADPWLDRLVGEWTIERTIRGEHVRNAMEARWVLGHQFVQMHMIDVAEPPQYEAIVLIGRDEESGRYVAHWCDDFGAAFAAVGRGERVGDAVEFRFEYPTGPFLTTFTWLAGEEGWRFLGEIPAKDGTRRTFADDHVLRRR